MTQAFDNRTGGHGAQGDVEEFSRILGAYNHDIVTQGRNGLFSAHKVAEDVYVRLLNKLYGWSLVNDNEPGHSVEAVDLVDDANRIVVQVTATCSSAKINSTLDSPKAAWYYERGYRLKFAFVGSEHDARKVQGTGSGVWALHVHDEDMPGLFDRENDTLFTSNLVARFKELGPAHRLEVLELARGDIGQVSFAQVPVNIKCKGYGRKQGRCHNDAIDGNTPYCEECYAERFVDTMKDLFVQQGYDIVDRIGTVLCCRKEEWPTAKRVVAIMCALPNARLSKSELYELLAQLDEISGEFSGADRLLVLDDAQDVGGDFEASARKSGIVICYKSELERRILDLAPYERYVEEYYEKNHMSDHVKLRPRRSKETLNDVVYSFLAEPVGDEDDGFARCRLLLGDFGVGKTSFCFSLAHDMFKHTREDDGKTHGYYPIMLRLRDLNNDRSLDKLITSVFVDTYDVKGFSLATFKRYLRNNRVLMLFDGFDEITKRLTVDAKHDVYKAICSYAIGETKIVVTCRPNFFQTAEEMRDLFEDTPMHYEPLDTIPLAFKEIVIDEFDDDQIREYLRHKERQLRRANLDVDGFLGKMRRIHDLSDLARRPVLLEMILDTLADILRADNASGTSDGVRVSAASLYKRYTSKWINREFMKGRRLFSKEHKADFCTFMAFKMFVDSVSSVSVREITNRIRNKYQVLAPEEVEAYANEIRSGSFFISNGDGTFGFVHRSFMEYFVAKELVRMLTDTNYMPEQCLGPQPFSTEIGRFAADIVRDEPSEKNVRTAVDRLRRASAEENRELRYNSVLLLSKIGEGEFLFAGHQEDFKGLDLANIELEDIIVEGCDFSSANLSRARMSGVTFVNCSFASSDLSEAILNNCRFEDSEADSSRWTGGTVTESEFVGVSLTNSIFNEARIIGCEFEVVDMFGITTSESVFADNLLGGGVCDVPNDVS